MRRSNLIFYGHADTQCETWDQSEKRVLDMCSKNTGLSLQYSCGERAHRLGQFSKIKSRFVIVKFCSTKYKDSILSACHKLKNTEFAVSEDFSPAVREACRKLIHYAKSQGKPFKLHFNKMLMGNQTFSFDSIYCCVIEDKKR